MEHYHNEKAWIHDKLILDFMHDEEKDLPAVVRQSSEHTNPARRREEKA